jgi:fructan beta-fructosidase
VRIRAVVTLALFAACSRTSVQPGRDAAIEASVEHAPTAGAGGGQGGPAGATGQGGQTAPDAAARDVAPEAAPEVGPDVAPEIGPEAGVDASAADVVPALPSFGDASFPYVVTNYDEPLRPQVHFTAPMGWLNDANGLWYQGGLYHLSYQAFPYSLEGDAKHWGHATSPDLVHWTHWPLMLEPGGNVPGDAWSGSTVVDVENTSGLKTGANPVLVTLYTATTKGTCVAYSNDLGVTWKAYDKNPVAVGGPTADTRDPHVFWHAPTHSWVLALYEQGTSFYTSPDLKTWTKRSHVDFGFECPDVYELPVDDVATNQKWVLQDASGSYLLGSFDGATFKPDSMTAHKMDESPDFYASQTFYRETMPGRRVVQIGWLRALDKATAPWNQALTFPTEVRLRTFPQGVRVTRTPIAELQTLHGASKLVGAQTLAAGVNPFAGFEAKAFDLTVVLDVAGTAAPTVDFKLANLSLVLDVAGRKMFGAPVSVLQGRIKVRVLRDWSQVEVFVNDGEVAFTKGFAFDPAQSSVSVTASSTMSLASAEVHALGRAWPGNAARASFVIDDGDARTTYAGAWTVAGEGRYFGAACHVARATGDAVQATFTGTRVEWYGLKNTDLGEAEVSIDGVVAATIDAYSARRQNALLFTKGGLASGPHTIKVALTGRRNARSTGAALVHDYFIGYVD